MCFQNLAGVTSNKSERQWQGPELGDEHENEVKHEHNPKLNLNTWNTSFGAAMKWQLF